MFCFFFFKQKTAYEMRISDWSSDVCSSDLVHGGRGERGGVVAAAAARRTADDPLPGRTDENHALVRHVAGNTRLRLRAESVLWRGAGTAGRGLVPGVSANSQFGKHTSELQSLMRISDAVFCLKKKRT